VRMAQPLVGLCYLTPNGGAHCATRRELQRGLPSEAPITLDYLCTRSVAAFTAVTTGCSAVPARRLMTGHHTFCV
jgi:hypothetical protein